MHLMKMMRYLINDIMIRGTGPRKLSDLSRDELLLVIQHIEHATAISVEKAVTRRLNNEWYTRAMSGDYGLYICCYAECTHQQYTMFGHDGSVFGNDIIRLLNAKVCNRCSGMCCGRNGHDTIEHDEDCDSTWHQ